MDSDIMGFNELSDSIGARLVSFSQYSGFSSVAIDSRNVKEGGLFFAMGGAKCDGHSFVGAAFDAGARAAVVESAKVENFDLVNTAKKAGKDLIVVSSTRKSLQDSARVYLEKFPNLLKIGITGSSGKTTTKEIAAAIISNEKNTVINKGNLNSETGLPLSVFDVRPHHEAGIFELGMNRRGEISEITFVLKPNIALVTNIGTAHIEYFGSKPEILKEKKCIFNFLSDNDVALIPKNDEYAHELADGVNAKVIFYGEDSFDELEQTRSLGLEGTQIIWAGEEIHFALPGKHSMEDALAAIAIAKEVPVSAGTIKKGLESVKPLFGRLEILKGRTTVIRDCYNANLESMAKSIEFCDSLEWVGRKAYVIGDMLELGENSYSFHARLGELLAESKADNIFLFGVETAAAAQSLASKGMNFFHTADIKELSAAIDSYVQTGDLVLLKGSRGCALERLTEMLTGGINDT
ncbi:MAG: UDP-N-acetylmuramoyl-tripeptide--D-alanyl-D-alanine ligase [Treponema sp.]|jgi:UDP-N-acetylmuramoyl-tripeptide--D-alanyl-D-alanine ligase|nr:UDP-N-acetylmuramoyl-tripeptide--D-alanyl-D-alanine ligase [Treponema sp.]